MEQLNTPGGVCHPSPRISPDGSTIILLGDNYSGHSANLVWTAEPRVLDLDSLIVHYYGFRDWDSMRMIVKDLTLVVNELALESFVRRQLTEIG
jgi:hypothetical protein